MATRKALPDGLTIRPYESRDIVQVWELHREGVRHTRAQYEADHAEYYAEYEKDLHDIETTYLDGGGFWVVEGAEGLVGMTAVERVDGRTGRLRRMRVTEDWRRRGIAQTLLDVAEEFCRDAAFARFVLDTTSDQTAAHHLYEANGFIRIGDRKLGPFKVIDYQKTLD